MKNKKQILSLSILLTLLTSCNDKVTFKDENVIWGTYSTEKVIKDVDYNHNNPHFEAKVEVSVANGEAETGQIIVTTGNKKVNSYKVETSDLKDENGNTYSANNVDVFFQHYLLLNEKTKGGRGYKETFSKTVMDTNEEYFPAHNNDVVNSGYIPDALIPQEYSIKFNENHIDANSNQGITFDFNVPKNTKYGTYKGNFKLILDDKEYSIPVTLNVWSFDISKTNGANLWDITEEYMATGELNTTDECYYAYYDALLKYKLNAYHFLESSDDEKDWVSQLRKYAKDERFNRVFLPDLGGERGRLYRYFNEITKACIEDKINYFEMCYFYHQAEDECQTHGQDMIDQCVETVTNNEKILLDYCQDIYNVEGFSTLDETLQNEIVATIKDMINLCTTNNRVTDLNGIVDTYCAPADEYRYTYDRRFYRKNADDMNGQAWIYCCINPWYPYPTYHIDDFLLSGRTLKWMQKDYDIDGFLMWSVNWYYKDENSDWRTPASTYGEPFRYASGNDGSAGDGYIFYPMAKYGASSPLPSIRLISARDGQEDYDTICKLESNYTNLANEYSLTNGLEIANNNLVNLYDKLYTSVFSNNDGKTFNDIRNSLGGLTEASNDESKTLIEPLLMNNGKNLLLNIYSKSNNVSINNKPLTKKNNHYEYVVALDDSNNNIKVSYEVNNITKEFRYYYPALTYNASVDSINAIVSEGSTLTKNANSFEAKLVSNYDPDDVLSLLKKIDLSIDLGVDYSELTSLSFNITNKGSVDAYFDVYVQTKDNKMTLLDKMISYSFESYNYELTNFDQMLKNISIDSKEVKNILLRFENVDSNNEKVDDRYLELSNFNYKKEAR